MKRDLRFDLTWEPMESGLSEEAATYASLGIVAQDRPLTRVDDQLSMSTRNVIRVSAYPLALWFASNWWRLRWEGPKRGHEWALVHRMAAAGAGYVWPDLTIESRGDYIQLSARETALSGMEAIAYLGNSTTRLGAGEFVAAVDGFVDTVIARLYDRGLIDTELQQLWPLIWEERKNPEMSEYRRLEALLGFDADDGSSEQISAFLQAGERLGQEAVSEIAAASLDISDLNQVEEALQQHPNIAEIEDFSKIREKIRDVTSPGVPWQRGESVARKVRELIGQPTGPLTNSFLQGWLSLSESVLHSSSETAVLPFAVAMREGADANKMNVVLRSRWQVGRRFELARLLGEHFLSAPNDDKMMPATTAKTARQSIQRAFAAELLLPADDLITRFDINSDDEDQIDTIAYEYDVSPKFVSERVSDKVF